MHRSMDLIASVWSALKFWGMHQFPLRIASDFYDIRVEVFLVEAIYRKASVITRVLVHPVSSEFKEEENVFVEIPQKRIFHV